MEVMGLGQARPEVQCRTERMAHIPALVIHHPYLLVDGIQAAGEVCPQ